MRQAIDENMDALSRAILNEARADADAILAEARKKADALLEQANAQAAEERKKILDRATEEATRLQGQASATANMKARTMHLENREKMLDRVFQEALKEIPNVQKWTDYPEIAQNLLREAVTQLRANEVQVRADSHTMSLYDQKFLGDVAREANVTIKVGEPLAQGTGVIVETLDGHVQFDNTLATRLRRMQNTLRPHVYQLLMGETA